MRSLAPPRSRTVKIALGVGISAALLVVLLTRVDLTSLGQQLAGTRWGWVAAGGALALLSVWVRARRWRYLFPPGSDVSALGRAAMIGHMVSNVVPFRAGEIVSAYVVARHWPHGFWLVLATVMVERVIDGLILIALLAILIAVAPVPAALAKAAAIFLAFAVAGALALAAVAAAPGACRRVVQALVGRWPSLERRALHALDTFSRGLVGVRAPAHSLPLLAWTAVSCLVGLLTSWAAMFAAGLSLGIVAPLAVMTFVGLGSAVPSAPGGIGVTHAAAVLALVMLGVPEVAALGYAVVLHAMVFVPITLCGWIFLLREHVSLREAGQAEPSA